MQEIPVAPEPEKPPLKKARPSTRLNMSVTISPDVAIQPPADAVTKEGLTVPPLGLSGALATVWVQNPQVRQAELALKATEFDIKGARAAYYPYLQIQASQGDGSQNSSTTLYAVLPLWNGGLTAAQVASAKAGQMVALADLNRIRLELGQRLLEAYFNVAQAQEQEQQWSTYVASLKKLLGSIERRASQGVAPEADVQTAVTRLKQAEAGYESVQALKLGGQAQLMSLLNAQTETVSWPSETDRLSVEELEKIGRDPIDVHPQRAATLGEIKRQEASAKASRAALSPELSLQHREQIQGVEFDPTNSATLLVAQFQTTNGLRGLLGYQAEKARVDAVRAQLVAVDREISATIEIDRAQLKASRSQLVVQQAAAESATALVDSFARQFEVGRKSWLEVLNAQREANDTLLQAISVRRNFWYYNAKLSLDSMYWDKLSPTVPSAPKEKNK